MTEITIKNLIAAPFDIQPLSGPSILPANGEVTADFSDFDIEVFHASPFIEVVEGPAPRRKGRA